MPQLKIATFNAEWMFSLFGAQWKDWQSPNIPATFPGKKLGEIKLDPISDVPALCERIAGVIKDVGAQIIGIEEGPPLKEQMEVFVQRFLNDEYVIHYSNSRMQSICALVHRSISDYIIACPCNYPETQMFRTPVPYYKWGGITEQDRKFHHFDRVPLILNFCPAADKELEIIVVHTKSKYSLLKTCEQWENRDREAILDALDARAALSAEVTCLRKYLDAKLAPPNEHRAIVVAGDLNEGASAELIEQEFLLHNIIDELAGSLLLPACHFRHAMTPDVLAKAKTTRFADPFHEGEIVEELIDHILISPGIWQGKAPFELKVGSCQVETKVYDTYNEDTGPKRERGLRPSDHKPVSAVFNY